jgi:DNA-directed RNA polymerase specialized sigma24 family protein
VQDALWSVVRRVEMSRGDSALGTWIYPIIANAAYKSCAAADGAKCRGISVSRPLTRKSVSYSLSMTGRRKAPIRRYKPSCAR